MRWFRSNIWFGSRLALFALAVQVVVSFAHVHVSDLASAPAAVSAVADGSSTPAAPGDNPNGATDPGCAICALIQLAATSAPSAAPVLPLPLKLSYVRLEATGDVALAALSHSFFQARAPPLV